MFRASQIPFRRFLSRNPFKHSPKPLSSLSETTPETANLHHRPVSRQFLSAHSARRYGSESESEESARNREVDTINLKFAEAREEIEMALESRETVYFNEEAECARSAVKEVLDLFDALLAKQSESERAALRRSMGLKIEQLKAELQQLNE